MNFNFNDKYFNLNKVDYYRENNLHLIDNNINFSSSKNKGY